MDSFGTYGKKNRRMVDLFIERQDGRTEAIVHAQEWGWQRSSGDLYYRKGGELKHIKVKAVKEYKRPTFNGEGSVCRCE